MRQDSVNRGNAGHAGRRPRPVTADMIAATDARFDLPPQFGGRDDRRMAARAEAMWATIAAAGRKIGRGARNNGDQTTRHSHGLPGHRSFETGATSEFASHALLLDLCHGDRVDVLWSGDAVRGAFGIEPGPLASDGDAGLAAHLLDSCELLRLTDTTVPLDSALHGADSACLLTRGVILPLADDAGALGFAYCVLNWKQVLDRDASDRLRREFGAALVSLPAHLRGFSQLGRQN